MPEIVFDKVRKSFGAVEVLPPLDLELNDSEFTVLVGPSGCGKSTTLRILAGLETLSGGEIYFDGRPIGGLEPKERDIAMVFQDYALYPHMNIARNMSFALRLAGVSKSEIEEKVTRVAKLLNIDHLLDRKPAELSGGQRQRVAMGRAMVRDAGTFLFDEPLSNLDAKLRAKMRTELAEMRDTIDKNMVYVTHDQVEAMTLGDRIVVMSDGKIQQQGSPEELFKRPVNRFVAGFIGSPTMNFLDGELHTKDGSTWVQGDGYMLPVTGETGQRVSQVATSRNITLGLRPSSIDPDVTAGAPIELHIAVAEYLGAQSVLVTRCGQTEVLAEIASAHRFESGKVRTFGVATDELMIFDRDSGLRL
ncbi:ABC transporter ATP-binding protein [Pontivivens insulae]|uniref:sn-glycerol-3-phosphate import ATP-binding protein UgpC n=1 Tax=Pontivivens insulae TaxID=1639689 RepID=A0A2R8A6T3_9RHOB|nr:sn-glycerol-3-phosphate ABC transporter ATP-binding protein UgpC [Pontivivens insulae]RED18047.1 carbohydrate ABC transporter ATP-binding protein (CUT1 family) [Pontivivens insulae]SPF27944.1 sn-glycerol-3-phosphate import ATP-binding protein UgpC [Pontivivens insulae]